MVNGKKREKANVNMGAQNYKHMEHLDRWACSCASLSRAPPLSLSLSLHCLLLVCAFVTAAPLLLSPLLLHPSIHRTRGGERKRVCVCVRERITSSAAELRAVVPVCLLVGSAGAGSLVDNSLLSPQSLPPVRADGDLANIHLLTPSACTPRVAERERYENSCAGKHRGTVEYHLN